MRCPTCAFEDSKVIDSRETTLYVRRRRKCLHEECNVRWTTIEVLMPEDLYNKYGQQGIKTAIKLWQLTIGEELYAKAKNKRIPGARPVGRPRRE